MRYGQRFLEESILKSSRFLFILLLYFTINLLLAAGTEAARTRDTIKIRVTATNPSREDTKKVPVLVYLPPEIEKENILSTGGLQLEYDSKASMYYVKKDKVELKPLEQKVFTVEVEDVWYIPEERMENLKRRAEYALEILEGTEHYDTSKKIADTAYKRLDGIVDSQEDEAMSRRDYIAAYRGNLSRFQQIREDVESIERYAALAGARPVLETEEAFLAKPSKAVTWMVIFVILTFVGILGGFFFFFWTRHARALEGQLPGSEGSDFTGPGPPSEGGGKEGGT